MNHASPTNEQEQWVIAWLQTVEAGLNTMSQRRLTSIEKHGGG